MKKVINGKSLNTNTAKFLGSYCNFLHITDWNYIYQEVYKTKTGVYFMYAEGGAATEYCEINGDGSKDRGNAIELLTIDEANAWLTSNGYDKQ